MNFEISRAVEWVAKRKPATEDWISEGKAEDGEPYLVEVVLNQFDVWACRDGHWTVNGELAPHAPRRIARIVSNA